jgi:hypothetical protein
MSDPHGMGNSEVPAEESKASEPIAKALEPIIENVTHSPGWAYLLMLVSLVTLGFKLQLPLLGQINFHNASLVLAITYCLYLVGDPSCINVECLSAQSHTVLLLGERRLLCLLMF